jgi:hypothetical protein
MVQPPSVRKGSRLDRLDVEHSTSPAGQSCRAHEPRHGHHIACRLHGCFGHYSGPPSFAQRLSAPDPKKGETVTFDARESEAVEGVITSLHVVLWGRSFF